MDRATHIAPDGGGGVNMVAGAFLFWLGAWALNAWLANGPHANKLAARLIVPLLFGGTLLVIWELVVRGLQVPAVILPPPSQIAVTLMGSLPILWADRVQTIFQRAHSAFALGR